MGPITTLLSADHVRIGGLIARAHEGDQEAYAQMRGALLRHIGIEEKILLPALRAKRGAPWKHAQQLRRDHSAIAAMLVPPPSAALLARLVTFLGLHDPLEEGEDGLYAEADRWLHDEPGLLARIQQAPIPPLADNFEGARAHAQIDLLLERAMALRAAG